MEPKLGTSLLVDLAPAASSVVSRQVRCPGRDPSASGTAARKKRKPGKQSGVVLGILMARDEAGNPLVAYPGCPGERFLPAQSTVPLGQVELGRQVALLLIEGDPVRPLVIGLLEPSGDSPRAEQQRLLAAEVDGERLVISAEREIVFRCGEASITLTRTGKVLIRGTYLLSRSSGVNRVKGGSVQIN